ncbi:MAG: hypothetical protein WA637_17230, partial [Terriglobales bacterium]
MPPLIAVDESPAGYSWQVALQQSPLPLHQPELYCPSSTSPDNASAANGGMSLNWLSQPRGPVHTIVSATDGMSAISVTRKEKRDAILLDLG